jgi:hypothetical protein
MMTRGGRWEDATADEEWMQRANERATNEHAFRRAQGEFGEDLRKALTMHELDVWATCFFQVSTSIVFETFVCVRVNPSSCTSVNSG